MPTNVFRHSEAKPGRTTRAASCHRLDKVGSVTGLACAIHCALMPIALTLLPTALGATIGSEWVEWTLFACSAIIGLTSVYTGRRVHGKSNAITVCLLGLTLLVLGRVGEEHHWGWKGVSLLVLGGAVVASAHLINSRLCKTCHYLAPRLTTNRQSPT